MTQKVTQNNRKQAKIQNKYKGSKWRPKGTKKSQGNQKWPKTIKNMLKRVKKRPTTRQNVPKQLKTIQNEPERALNWPITAQDIPKRVKKGTETSQDRLLQHKISQNSPKLTQNDTKQFKTSQS